MAVIHKVFDDLDLLTSPKKRAGWSDRTALFMAEMSQLAYIKFEEREPPTSRKQSLPTKIINWVKSRIPGLRPSRPPTGVLLGQNDLSNVFTRVMIDDDQATETSPEGTDPPTDLPPIPPGATELRDKVQAGGFKLVGLISDESTDTQAFIASTDPNSTVRPFGDEKVVILSFRGTASIADWQTNAKFRQGDDRKGSVHSGFQNAFNSVKPLILELLNPLIADGHTLYITGHSLGGALAIIATRDIGYDSTGACYTFGQPRVARFGFAQEIKTPIYRVINSNDLVPRVPPAYLITVIMTILKILNVPWIRPLQKPIKRYEQYVHHGDMRYLRLTPPDDFSNLQVYSNPSVIYRTIWFFTGFIRHPRSPIDNHSISLYANKLAAHAKSRLKESTE